MILNSTNRSSMPRYLGPRIEDNRHTRTTMYERHYHRMNNYVPLKEAPSPYTTLVSREHPNLPSPTFVKIRGSVGEVGEIAQLQG